MVPHRKSARDSPSVASRAPPKPFVRGMRGNRQARRPKHLPPLADGHTHQPASPHHHPGAHIARLLAFSCDFSTQAPSQQSSQSATVPAELGARLPRDAAATGAYVERDSIVAVTQAVFSSLPSAEEERCTTLPSAYDHSAPRLVPRKSLPSRKANVPRSQARHSSCHRLPWTWGPGEPRIACSHRARACPPWRVGPPAGKPPG